MSEEAASVESKSNWYDSKTLVIAWVLVFFPVGLYGVWKSDDFIRNVKFGVSVACVIGFFGLGINFVHPLYVFVMYPTALFLLWRAPEISKKLTVRFAIGFPIILILALFAAGNGQTSVEGGTGGSCSAVITQGNCTYYRDDNCNVIGSSCS